DPNQVSVTFDTDVSASLSAGTLQMVNSTTGQALSASDAQLATTNTNGETTAVWTFPNISSDSGITGVLPDGWWSATINASDVTDANNQPLHQSLTIDCPALAGDTNNDQTVDQTDQSALLSNFGNTSAAYSQGDLNYDGKIDTADWASLSPGKTLAPPPTASG